MSLASLCLALVLLPQNERDPRLVLPKPTPVAAPVERESAQLAEVDRFYRDVIQLRKSARLSQSSRDFVLKEISGAYREPNKLALQLARTAESDLMHGLLHVLQRYGAESDAKEMLFLLLTRPFRGETKFAVEVTAELSRDKAKSALMSCFTARFSSVRKAATDLLLARIDESDLDAVLALSRDEQADVRRKALFLLGALPYEGSRLRLLEAISEPEPIIAAAACESLIGHGADAVPALVEIVARPPRGREFGYAAFALSVLEDQTGRVHLTEEAVPHLAAELTGFDPFTRATAALALTNLAFRSEDRAGEKYHDRDIVDALLLVVAPQAFVPNISMLQRSATRKLMQFAAQDFRGRNAAWHAWWERARPGFVGTRLVLPISPETGADAVLYWSDAETVSRLRGENVPFTPGEEGVNFDDYVVTGPEMHALVTRLREQGFMTQGLLASAATTEMLPVVRTLDLRLGTARSQVSGPAAPARWLDALGAEVRSVIARERWQLYSDAATDAERLEFWRSEREWLAANPDRIARSRRFIDHVLAAYSDLSEPKKSRAISHLESMEGLRDLLTEEHGSVLLEEVARAGVLDGATFRLLELALFIPGDLAWRGALAVVDRLHDDGGEEVLPRVFSLLGPDKVLAAMSEERPTIQSAAILEIAKLRDVRATPRLLELLRAEDRRVVEAAAYALGVLRSDEARNQLIALQSKVGTPSSTRRVALVALGRIGGEGVFEILQSAVAAVELQDQLAAIQGLGELRDIGAAHFLAQIFIAHGLNPIGTQAMVSLQKIGGLLARPALRRHLAVRDPRVRQEIVLLLAEFSDPTVVPDLTTMIQENPNQIRPVLLLSSITGLDLIAANDRVEVLRQWWRLNGERSQPHWFIDALARNKVDSTLRVEQLGPGAGLEAVEELSRLMVAMKQSYLRVLAAALLRDVTNRDFGLVSMQTPVAQLQAVADRYRFFADAERAASGR